MSGELLPIPDSVLRRVERQQALVERLAARAPRACTTADLAEHLGVAARTVERDLADLREIGLPLRVRRGPGGGHSLPLRRDTVIELRLDMSEVAAMVAALTAVGPWSSASAARLTDRLLAALQQHVNGREHESANRDRPRPRRADSD